MKFEFSAGGIVFKKNGETSILVSQHSQHHGWVFPKGIIAKQESKEDTAVREVEEETGIKAKILKPLESVSYWYVLEGEKIKKTVYYFLMEFLEDTGVHDTEMEAVEWIPYAEVEHRLTYKSDRQVWQQAEKLI